MLGLHAPPWHLHVLAAPAHSLVARTGAGYHMACAPQTPASHSPGFVTGALTGIVGSDRRHHGNSAFLSKSCGKNFLSQLQEESHFLKHHLKQAFPAHGAQHITCLSSPWNSKTLCQVLQTIVRYLEAVSQPLHSDILAAALATVLEKLMLTSHSSRKGQMLSSWLICTHS